MSSSGNNRAWAIVVFFAIGIIFGIGPFKNLNCKHSEPQTVNYSNGSSEYPADRSQPSFGGNSSNSSLERELREAEQNRDYYLKEARTAHENGTYYINDNKPDIAASYFSTEKEQQQRAGTYERKITELRAEMRK